MRRDSEGGQSFRKTAEGSLGRPPRRWGLNAGQAGQAGQDGFTLVELMMVVTIVGILANLAVPSFQRSIVKSREAALKQSLYTMRDVIDQYKADQGVYPPVLDDLASAGYLRRIPEDPFTRSDGTWQEIIDETDGGIFDVHSGSDLVALDGTPYNQW